MTHVRHLSSKHYIPRVQYSTYIMYTQTQFILMLILRKVGGVPLLNPYREFITSGFNMYFCVYVVMPPHLEGPYPHLP